MSQLIVRTVSAYNDMIRAVVDEVIAESGEGRSADGILAEALERFQSRVVVSKKHRSNNHANILVEELEVEEIEIKA